MLNRWDNRDPEVHDGWRLNRHTAPSGLYGAAGMIIGDDGLLHVVQHYGNQVSAIDVVTGTVKTEVPKGGGLPAPDDIAFDTNGTMIVTQPQYGHVSIRRPDGATKVIADVPMANGIVAQGDRVFVNQTMPDGRILEVFTDGSEPRVVAQGLMLANGHAIGPDGHIYWPEMSAGEIWRVPLDGGQPTRFLGGLAMPTAVKFSSDGLMTAVSAGNGDVVQSSISDPRLRVIAKMHAGLDNLAFNPQGRLFVSNFVDGGVAELAADGTQRSLVDAGLLFPCGLAFDAGGTLYAADGMSLRRIGSDGSVTTAGSWLVEGFPGWIRSVAPAPDGTVYITSSSGTLMRWNPDTQVAGESLVTGLGEVLGMAWSADTGLLIAEAGASRVLRVDEHGTLGEVSRDARRPAGIAIAKDGVFVSDEAAGCILLIDEDGDSRRVCSGLDRPQGIAFHNGQLYVIDAGRHELSVIDLATGDRSVIVSALPVGDPPGVDSPSLPGMPGLGLTGPLSAFADLAVAADGSIYIGADGEGSILHLRSVA